MSIHHPITPIRLLLLDLDGTLVDSFRDIATSCNLLLAGLGAGPLADADIRPCIGRGVRFLVEGALRRAGRRAEDGLDVDAAIARYRDIYRAHALDATRLYPGVGATLETLAGAGLRLAVISNKPEEASRGILEHFGVAHLFDSIAGGDSHEEMKPSPLPLRRVMAECGIDASEAVMMGDSVYDIQAGKGAGVRTVAALYGFQPPETLKALEPDFSVSAFTEILDLPIVSRPGI